MIRGVVPAANYLRIPKSKEATLGLTGRFCYFQVHFTPGDKYAIHCELQSTSGNMFRLSISNIFGKKGPQRTSAGLQVPFSPEPGGWTLLAVDLAACMRLDEPAKPGSKPVVGGGTGKAQHTFQCLRNVQVCASLSIRGIFTSDNFYKEGDLPSALLLSQALPPSLCSTVWLPCEPEDVQQAVLHKPAGGGTATRRHRLQRRVSAEQKNLGQQRRGGGGESALQDVDQEPEQDMLSLSDQTCSSSESEEENCGGSLSVNEEHGLQLVRLNSFSGDVPKQVVWPEGRDSFVYAAGPTLVEMDAREGEREGACVREFGGHTARVCCLAAFPGGRVLVSSQEGPFPHLRLWDLQDGSCLGILDDHGACVTALDVSPDGRCLAAVGPDPHNRSSLMLWAVEGVDRGVPARPLLSYSSSHHTLCIRWDPDVPESLLACGRCSIRSYRYKGGALHGMSIGYTQAGGQAGPSTNTFTDIGFEVGPNPLHLQGRRAFVASASGAIYQVNSERRVVEAIYQVHMGPVNCLIMHAGFAVTASDDGLVRMWPLDFRDFLLEAKLSLAVTVVATSSDGLHIVCGTEDRSLGVLDVVSRQYRPLLRAHRASITALAVHPCRAEMATASADGSVRLWQVPGCRQTLGFEIARDTARALAFHPSLPDLAAAFSSGLLRIFDTAKSTVAHSIRQHSGPISACLFRSCGDTLLTLGEDGVLCSYAAGRGYLPTASVVVGAAMTSPCLAMSPDGARLALSSLPKPFFGTYSGSLHQDSQGGVVAEIGIRSARSFQQMVGCSLSEGLLPTVLLALPPPNEDALIALFSSGLLRIISLSDGRALGAVETGHSQAVAAIAVDKTGGMLATGGADRLIKLWELQPQQGGLGIRHVMTMNGHVNGVTHLAFTDQNLVAAGSEGALSVWKLRLARAAQIGSKQDGPSIIMDGLSIIIDKSPEGAPAA
eukprot:jgi/Botrbrau1/13899/Bobra.0017s0006.2